MRCRTELARRLPRRVLGFEEPPELLVGDVQSQVAEELADEARVLDLLERPGHPEERLVVLAEIRRHLVRVRHAVAPERLDAGAVTCLEKLRLVGELHERVAPVEEDRAKHHGNLVPHPAIHARF